MTDKDKILAAKGIAIIAGGYWIIRFLFELGKVDAWWDVALVRSAESAFWITCWLCFAVYGSLWLIEKHHQKRKGR